MVRAFEVVEIVALHHIAMGAFGSLEKLLEHALIREIIRLDDADILAPGLRNPQVQRCAVAGVLLVDHANTRIASSVLVQYGRRPIRSAIVDADDLDISKRLPAKRIQALRQKPLHIVNRNQNRNFWSGHRALAPKLLKLPIS